MKLRKQIKNRAVAVVMLAVVLVSSISVSFADYDALPKFHYDITVDGLRREVSCDSVGNKPIYLFEFLRGNDEPLIYIACESPFSGKQVYYDEKNEISNSFEIKSYLNHCDMFGDVYCSSNMNKFYWNNNVHRIVVDLDKYRAFMNSGEVKHDAGENLEIHIMSATVHGGLSEVGIPSEWCHVAGDDIEGSQVNPQKDEDIGYLVLKTTNTNTQTDLDALKNGIQSVHYNLDWKNKTSTGFSLSKNKYARTFIQFEVESQYVVYSDAKHTKIKHKFDNYGERGWIAKNWDATSKPFSLTTDQVNAALPKSTNEILTQFDQNKIYQTGFTNGNIAINPLAFNFKIRYRVVCTDDIAVIPDSSGGWYAGPWASTIISGDEINDTSSHKSNHEGYGDDKNDNGESDDINHTKTDYDDNQDAKDHINDIPSDNDSDLTIDKAISFVKQVTKVPKLIGLALSWLPDWVTAPFFLAFALIPILIIYKFLRG